MLFLYSLFLFFFCTKYKVNSVSFTLFMKFITETYIFLQVKIRGSSTVCTVCGENSAFTQDDFQKFDYENFTQSPMSDKVCLQIIDFTIYIIYH